MIEITVRLDEEQIEEVFENAEVKFSKAKLKKLAKLADEQDEYIKEGLEDALKESLEELVTDEWGS